VRLREASETSVETTASSSPVPEAPYDRIAARYRDWWAPVLAPAAVRLLDLVGGLLSTDWRGTLVDVGTGSGTLALGALRRWPGARVIGVDPARRLLELAEAAAFGAGLQDRLTTRVGKAASLPLPDASVDAAVSSFVIQLTPSRAAALRETIRVLRHGGVFACLTWRFHEDPIEPGKSFDDALRALGIERSPAQPRGDRPYRSPTNAAAELRRAGFQSVLAREEWLEHRFTPKAYLDLAEHWIDDAVFADLDDAMRRRLRTEALRRLERLPPDRLVWRRPLVSAVGTVGGDSTQVDEFAQSAVT
jgi:SAM-dependent methyltransferase